MSANFQFQPVMTTQAIAQRMTLVTLTMSAWRPSKLHKQETASERARHGTQNVRVYTTLTDHPTLKAVMSAQTAIYTAHASMTLPGAQDGMRILPSGRQFAHAQEIGKLVAAHDAAVSEFIAAYDSIQHAQSLLPLYDSSQWDTREKVRNSFRVQYRYLPAPSDGAWGEWIEESARIAQADIRQRVIDALKRTIERCGSDGRLYASVFDQFDQLVPDLNLMDDPIISRVLTVARRELAPIVAAEISGDKRTRQAVADRASELLDMFGAGSVIL